MLKKNNNNFWMVSGLVVAICLILFTFSTALKHFANALFLTHNGILTTGVVVEQMHHSCRMGGSNYNCYYPRVTYVNTHNSEFTFTNPTDYLGKSVYPVGQTVHLLYDSRNPTHAIVNEYSEVMRDALTDFAYPLFFIVMFVSLLCLHTNMKKKNGKDA